MTYTDSPHEPHRAVHYGTPPGTPAPHRRRHVRRWAAAALALCAAAATAAAAVIALRPEPSFTMAGSMALSGFGSFDATATPCTGSDGYDDITTGAQVTVYDATGKVIATSQLQAGLLGGGDITAPTKCTFPFTAQVPDSDYYAVEVSHRGKVTFTRAQARAGDVALSLG